MGEAEVVVVAHAGDDRTAEITAAHDGLRVVELEESSRSAAMDAGEASVTASPRLFVDPTAFVTAEGMRLLAKAQDVPGPRFAARAEHVLISREQRVADAHSIADDQTPRQERRATHLGVYGLPEAVRAKFSTSQVDEGDQTFMRRLFLSTERVLISSTASESGAARGRVRSDVAVMAASASLSQRARPGATSTPRPRGPSRTPWPS